MHHAVQPSYTCYGLDIDPAGALPADTSLPDSTASEVKVQGGDTVSLQVYMPSYLCETYQNHMYLLLSPPGSTPPVADTTRVSSLLREKKQEGHLSSDDVRDRFAYIVSNTFMTMLNQMAHSTDVFEAFFSQAKYSNSRAMKKHKKIQVCIPTIHHTYQKHLMTENGIFENEEHIATNCSLYTHLLLPLESSLDEEKKERQHTLFEQLGEDADGEIAILPPDWNIMGRYENALKIVQSIQLPSFPEIFTRRQQHNPNAASIDILLESITIWLNSIHSIHANAYATYLPPAVTTPIIEQYNFQSKCFFCLLMMMTMTVIVMVMNILTSAISASCSFYSYTPHFPSPAPSFTISLYLYHHPPPTPL